MDHLTSVARNNDSKSELHDEEKQPEIPEVVAVPESPEYQEYIILNNKYQGAELKALTVSDLHGTSRTLLT